MSAPSYRHGTFDVPLLGDTIGDHFERVAAHVIFADEFPMTVTGKVQKFKMREASIERLGLGEAAAVRSA